MRETLAFGLKLETSRTNRSQSKKSDITESLKYFEQNLRLQTCAFLVEIFDKLANCVSLQIYDSIYV